MVDLSCSRLRLNDYLNLVTTAPHLEKLKLLRAVLPDECVSALSSLQDLRILDVTYARISRKALGFTYSDGVFLSLKKIITTEKKLTKVGFYSKLPEILSKKVYFHLFIENDNFLFPTIATLFLSKNVPIKVDISKSRVKTQ